MPETKRSLKVFLCHAHPDRNAVHDLYLRLIKDSVDAWLDKEKLIGGQDWEFEIRKAVRESDVVIVCLSKQFAQRGFRQQEVRIALEEANFQPEGEIFIIPLRLEECNVPQSLRRWHWVDLFERDGYERLMRALRARADKIGAPLQVKRSWLPKITSPHSLHQKSIENKKPEAAKKQNGEEKVEFSPDHGLPQIDEPLLPPEKFSENWENECQPSFEPENTKRKEENIFSANSELKPFTIEQEHEAAEKAKPEREERSAPRQAALKKAFSKAVPSLRVVSILGIVFALLWLGSLTIPMFRSPVPTARASLLPTNIITPTSESLQAEIVDSEGVQMVLVRAGEFTMGGGRGLSNENPAHVVYLDAFYIDKYEVTNALYRVCVGEHECLRPVDTSLYYISTREKHPVVTVDWNMANAYCRWRGARLPTEAQWEKAARAEDRRTYPWGEVLSTKYANYNSNDTRAVGRYQFVKSPYGVYDMAGNVAEWVYDWYGPNYYQTVVDENISNPMGPDKSQFDLFHNSYGRVFRGGSWKTTDSYQLSTTYRSVEKPDSYKDYLGFRCAKNANP